MRGAIPPLPNTPSWRGAQLKDWKNFTITSLALETKDISVRFHSQSEDVP